MMKLRSVGGALGVLLLGLAGPALADSISPSSYTASTTVGGKLTLHKDVTVSAGRPTAAKADIFFLTDTTGSMGGTIDTVKSSFTSIASGLSGDIAFGAGQFKDTGDVFTYNLDQDITSNIADVQTAINSWSPGGGGDTPEQGLYALSQVATGTDWRDGAKKIVLIAGDATAKTDLISLSGAADDLIDNGVTVESIDVGDLNGAGQFFGPTSIYGEGVSGEYFTSFGDDLVDTIQAAIGSAFLNYSNVTLQVVGAPGVDVTWTPTVLSGSFDRSIDRLFGFDLTFTGLTRGTHNFSINALVDGGVIATELDSITVGGVPEPASWAMMIMGFAAIGGAVRHQRRRLVAQAMA